MKFRYTDEDGNVIQTDDWSKVFGGQSSTSGQTAAGRSPWRSARRAQAEDAPEHRDNYKRAFPGTFLPDTGPGT